MKIMRSSSGNYGSSGGIDPASTPTVPPQVNDLGVFHRRVYWYSFALGFGLLLPFNFVINLIPWLSAQYAWPDFGFYASLALNNPVLAIQIVLLPFGRLVPSGHRIRGSLATGAVALVLIAFAAVHAPRWVGLALIAATGTAEAVMEATLFALLGQLPSASYTQVGERCGLGQAATERSMLATLLLPGALSQAFMAGMGMAGVAAAALALGLHVALGSHVPGLAEVGAYVLIGVAVLLACVAVHTQLVLIPLIAELIGGSSDVVASALGGLCGISSRRGHEESGAARPQSRGRLDDDLDTVSLLDNNLRPGAGCADGAAAPTWGPSGVSVSSPIVSAILRPEAASSPTASPSYCTSPDYLPGRLLTPAATPAEPEHGSNADAVATAAVEEEHWLSTLRRVAWAAANPAAAVAHTFTATFLVYPGLLAIIPQRSSTASAAVSLDADAWFSLLLLVYALGDFAGRSVAGRHRSLPPRWLHAYALARYGLVPVLVGCAQGWNGFTSDWIAVVAVAVVGLSNGHVATLAVMQQPATPDGDELAPAKGSRRLLADRDLTGLLLGACLKAGIVAGSDFAVLLAGAPRR